MDNIEIPSDLAKSGFSAKRTNNDVISCFHFCVTMYHIDLESNLTIAHVI